MRVLKCFLISFFITFCESGSLPCKNCARRKTDLAVEQLKLLRYEFLKHQILQKLNLMEPPKINLPKPPLNSLLDIAEMTQNDTAPKSENRQKTESIVIYPKNENITCSKHDAFFCNRFEFFIPPHVVFENYLSADIWIRNSDTNFFRAYQILEDILENITNYYELNYTLIGKTSWIKYNALDESIWLNVTSDNVLVIEIIDDRTETHTEDIVSGTVLQIPFLVIRIEVVDEKGVNRQRRSATCSGNSPSCCKENFYLNFREIGWDNWILHPDGYQANFCRGRCFNDLSNTRFYHSAVLFSFIHDNKDIAEEIGLSMCCTPSIMGPLTIFYRNEEGLIYQKKIENMRVEACDCA